jgi:hypothetical protein
MNPDQPDSAAVFACALSLHRVCLKSSETDPALNLSESYNGIDQFMREVMRIGEMFENWACHHVTFEELSDVWSYFLEEHFGDAVLTCMLPGALACFDDDDCLRVALHLRFPIRWDESLRLPVDMTRENPVSGSGFALLRIRTMRERLDESDVAPFSIGDDPFDDAMDAPFFALYGLDDDGLPEHIADRSSYEAIRDLAAKLAPGVDFPELPGREIL